MTGEFSSFLQTSDSGPIWDWHEQAHRERTGLVNEMTNVFDDRDWCYGSLHHLWDLPMIWHQQEFWYNDVTENASLWGSDPISPVSWQTYRIVGHALSENTSQFRERERERDTARRMLMNRVCMSMYEYLWVWICGVHWDPFCFYVPNIWHWNRTASGSCCRGQSQQGLSGLSGGSSPWGFDRPSCWEYMGIHGNTWIILN